MGEAAYTKLPTITPTGYASTAAILVISLLACFLPKLISSTKFVKRYFSLANIFTGGLQLATILVDLVPHMVAKKGHVHNSGELYPFVLSGLCFLGLVALDLIVLHPSPEKKTSKKGVEKTVECAPVEVSPCVHSEIDHHHAEEGHVHHEHDHDHDHDHCHSHENIGTCNTAAIATSKTTAKAVIFLLAISIHSFFEGLSTNANEGVTLRFVGLVLHKLLESFAIGAAVHDSTLPGAAKGVLFFIYSMLTPVAMIVGFSQPEEIARWANGLCLGAMLFVVFFEIIGHALHDGKDSFIKMATLLAGYALGCASIVLSHGSCGASSSTAAGIGMSACTEDPGCTHEHHHGHHH